MTVVPANDADVHKLLGFYETHFAYYRKWARLHRLGYWILLWLLIGAGSGVAVCLLLKTDLLITAAVSLLLNITLVASKFIDAESKWARYRTVEIRLGFALQSMWASVSRRMAAGAARDQALFLAIEELHPKVETLVLEEFGEFFSRVKSLQEIDSELAARGVAGRAP